MEERQILRQQFCRKRQTLSLNQRKTASKQLTENLSNHLFFQNSQHIAFYSASGGEIDPQSLLQLAWQKNKICYLPVLDPKQGHQLCFLSYYPQDVLIPNCYKIPEPAIAPHKITPVTNLDLVLVPLVVFDEQGNRLGMGAGYYDRTFAFLQKLKRPAKPYLLGLAYEWQKIEKLQLESWDVRLDGVATEVAVYEL